MLPLRDEVQELQPAVGVLLGDRHHERRLATISSSLARSHTPSPWRIFSIVRRDLAWVVPSALQLAEVSAVNSRSAGGGAPSGLARLALQGRLRPA